MQEQQIQYLMERKMTMKTEKQLDILDKVKNVGELYYNYTRKLMETFNCVNDLSMYPKERDNMYDHIRQLEDIAIAYSKLYNHDNRLWITAEAESKPLIAAEFGVKYTYSSNIAPYAGALHTSLATILAFNNTLTKDSERPWLCHITDPMIISYVDEIITMLFTIIIKKHDLMYLYRILDDDYIDRFSVIIESL